MKVDDYVRHNESATEGRITGLEGDLAVVRVGSGPNAREERYQTRELVVTSPKQPMSADNNYDPSNLPNDGYDPFKQ